MTSLLESSMMTGRFTGRWISLSKHEVVLAEARRAIEAERIGRRHERQRGVAELAIGAGIVDVPHELLGRRRE